MPVGHFSYHRWALARSADYIMFTQCGQYVLQRFCWSHIDDKLVLRRYNNIV